MYPIRAVAAVINAPIPGWLSGRDNSGVVGNESALGRNSAAASAPVIDEV